MSNFRCSIQNIKRHQDAVSHTSSHSIVPVILSLFGGLLLCLISGAAFKILRDTKIQYPTPPVIQKSQLFCRVLKGCYSVSNFRCNIQTCMPVCIFLWTFCHGSCLGLTLINKYINNWCIFDINFSIIYFNDNEVTAASESDPHNFEAIISSSKNFEASTGFKPMTSAIPVQCFTNWAIKPCYIW